MPQSGKRKLIEKKLGEDLRDKRRKKQPLLSSIREGRARMARIKRGHVDICLCPFCQNECRERTRSHEAGRCVIICNNFRGMREEKSSVD